MFPTIIAIGPIVIQSLQIMIVIAIFFGLFAFWRKTKEEHYDEMMVFDGVLLSLLAGFVLARIAFIITFFERFGWNPFTWIDIFSNPGFNLTALFVGSAVYLFRYAKDKKWDEYEILDFWSVGMSIALAFIWFGYWLAGIGFGTATRLPWGMVFAGLIEPHHPVQLYYVAFFIGLAWYLSWAEYRYRTYKWYRAHKNTAQTGFLISVMLLASGFWALLLLPITIAPSHLFGIRLDALTALCMFIGGSYLLYARSGQDFFKGRAKK